MAKQALMKQAVSTALRRATRKVRGKRITKTVQRSGRRALARFAQRYDVIPAAPGASCLGCERTATVLTLLPGGKTRRRMRAGLAAGNAPFVQSGLAEVTVIPCGCVFAAHTWKGCREKAYEYHHSVCPEAV